ncbi:MAG: tetratricopeptide repeat protein [Pseudomonadota bacterium]
MPASKLRQPINTQTNPSPSQAHCPPSAGVPADGNHVRHSSAALRGLYRLLWGGTLAIAVAACQSVTTTPNYDVLAERVGAGDEVKVADLRAAFFADDDSVEELAAIIELERQALALLADQPLRLGAIGNAILERNYGSLTGHLALQRFYEHVESPDTAAIHADWLERISAYIETAAGSAEDPYPVLSSAEAEAYLLHRDQELVGSMYHSREAHPLVLLTAATDAASQRLISRYFDLSRSFEVAARDANAARAEAAAKAAAAGEASSKPDPFAPGELIGQLAQEGDTAAQAFIGTYMASKPRTIDQAIEWLKQASQRGNVIANLMLARAYWSKAQGTTGAERHDFRELMADNYTHAIALGSDEAMFSLGSIYLAGEFGADNRVSGVALLKQAATAKNVNAGLLLAHMHYRGEVVEQDLDAAEQFFHEAAATGSRRAALQYARFLYQPQNERAFNTSAVSWLEDLAARDDAEAMLLLGNLNARGIGVDQNYRRALGWFKSAVKVQPDDANIVNEVAWTLTVTELAELRSASYALRIMSRMMEGDDKARRNPAYLDTWAAAYAANGKFVRAVELQEEALDVARQLDNFEGMGELEEHLQTFNDRGTVIDPVP